MGIAYSLLPRLCDMLVRFEERSDVQCLAAPKVTMYGPVQRQLQGAAVQRPGYWIGIMSVCLLCIIWFCSRGGATNSAACRVDMMEGRMLMSNVCGS